MELKQMEPRYIKNLGNWKPGTQDEWYLDKITNKIIKAVSGDS